MKLLLSSLLLASLCALSSWSVSSTGTPAVTQTPDVSVAEGQTVNISCCWTLDISRIRVRWMKNQTNIKNDTVNSKNHSQGFLQNATSHCSHLTFTDVKRKDSGRYVCMVIVEIPTLSVIEGNGTVITVMALKNPNDSTVGGHPGSSRTLPPLIISLAVVGPLLLISFVCFLTLRRRQASANAARVIYEVPHIDSEEVEMDKHSTSSSRGSSQWCQVPVYESCDYFERVVTKESG